MSDTAARTGTPPAAVAVGVLALAGAAGALVMTAAHMGVQLPLLPSPGLILPAAISFAVGTVLYGVVAIGAFGVRRWTPVVGGFVNGLAFASAAFPFRGPVSAIAMAVSLAAIVVLFSPAGRRAFRRR